MSNRKNAIRLLHVATLRRMRRVAVEGDTAWYDTEEGMSARVVVAKDRIGRPFEQHSIDNGSQSLSLTIRNGEVSGPMTGPEHDTRLRTILHDLCDGTTKRTTASQARRIDMTTSFARLLVDDVDGMPIVFHPRTIVSAGWVEFFLRNDERSPCAERTAQWLCGEQRRARSALKGSGSTYDVEGRGENRIVMPIRDTIERLRTIDSLRRSAVAEGLDADEVDLRLGECGL